MSVRVTDHEHAALYDSVTGLAFGPLFNSPDDADEFVHHLERLGERDPRVIPAVELAQLHREWQEEREDT